MANALPTSSRTEKLRRITAEDIGEEYRKGRITAAD